MFDRVLDEAGAASVIPLIRILTQFVGGVDAVCLVAPLAVGDLNPGVAWYGKGTALFAVRVHREDHDAVGATRCVIRLVAPDVQAENHDIYPLVDIGMVRQIRIDARKDLYA